SLYVRPLMIGTESHLDVRPDSTYRFMVMTAPVGSYFGQGKGGVSLKAEDQFTRAAALGGLGYAKTAANYAAGMFATQKARAEGFDQVLWLDSNEHRFVEEVGAMNIFFKKRDAVVSPPLGGSILPGVTRDSVISLIRDQGLTVEERKISIDEVMESVKDGSMEEVFGAGTAAVIAPVERLAFKGETVTLPQVPGPLTMALYDEILGIQNGRLEDRHGWNMVVPLPKAQPATAVAR
ncbi:MAG TPA: aminotransferase class IV, partial [Nitrospiria bacterium]|nr:aminotransferase class IV [Nitrospiria bacterium]